MADRETTHEQLLMAIQNESRKFQEFYLWLEKAMPPLFFEEVNKDNIMLIAHSLMGFHLQDYFSTINLKKAAIVLCLNSPDADLRILQNYAMYGIKNYQCYISNSPPPVPGANENLRIATIYFTEAIETVEIPYPAHLKEKLRLLVKEKIPEIGDEEFEQLISGINTRFLRSMSMERLVLAIEMFHRAKSRDNCQYEVRYNEDWQKTGGASMQIVLAWRNTPKHNFLYRVANTIYNHGMMIKRVNATYINPYKQQNILIMSLALHGSEGEAVWEAADIPLFLRDLSTMKYFSSQDRIQHELISKKIITNTMGNFLRAMAQFIHQALVHVDPLIYTLENVEEGLCRHPELTVLLCNAFQSKFDPDMCDLNQYETLREQILSDVKVLDTGHEFNDTRRKNILQMGMSFIHHTLKTNFYRLNYTALGFRLDPKYLDDIPLDRTKKFPILPFGIFFIKGMFYFGFHIRFKDLSRGGLRTVFVEQAEKIELEQNAIFTECYNLALTQQMKNKDIPEGGSKGVIFLRPSDRLESEAEILQMELEGAKIDPEKIEKELQRFRQEQKVEYLHESQRSYVETLLTLIDCEAEGTLKARHIVDYWKKPEYIYLGPDENMHDEIIQWIADLSKKYNYKPGSAFITGKAKAGINHKEYGVTSLGVTVYMDTLLRHMGIDPTKQTFTVKMSGGPDGDVAGNQILNLARDYSKTAKLVALTDVSGTIYDAQGLDFGELVSLFHKGNPISFYNPKKLSNGGFLVDKNTKRQTASYVQQTLCWRNRGGQLQEEWITSSEMNQLLRNNVHQTPADIFIPGGGRPLTLYEGNYKEFLDQTGKPTAKAIVEGANLYLTPGARLLLEELGVYIIKDSSANKTGVICSSFEVLCILTLGDEKFLNHKAILVEQILHRLKLCAQNEANLLLRTHEKTGEFLTIISDQISNRINEFTYQILDYLEMEPLPTDSQHPLLATFLDYCFPFLRENCQKELLNEIPEHHKKAIIASHLAAQLAYKKGLEWYPSIVDVLPILLHKQLKISEL